MRFLTGLIIFVCMTSSAMAAESFQALFDRANKHYESGDFKPAANLYRAIEKQGCINDKVSYNLANCYLKQGDLGHAVLYYRRALQIAPRDSDIIVNLNLARSFVYPDNANSDDSNNATQFVFPKTLLTDFEIAMTVLILYLTTTLLITFAFVSYRRRIRKRLFRLSIVFLILFICSGVILGKNIHSNHFMEFGVLLTQDVIAKDGPDKHFDKVFKLQPGTEFIINRHKSGWTEITLHNGYTGWIPDATFDVI